MPHRDSGAGRARVRLAATPMAANSGTHREPLSMDCGSGAAGRSGGNTVSVAATRYCTPRCTCHGATTLRYAEPLWGSRRPGQARLSKVAGLVGSSPMPAQSLSSLFRMLGVSAPRRSKSPSSVMAMGVFSSLCCRRSSRPPLLLEAIDGGPPCSPSETCPPDCAVEKKRAWSVLRF